MHVFPVSFPEHSRDDEAVGGYLGGADGASPRGIPAGGVAIWTSEHMYQRVLRTFAVDLAGSRRTAGIDDGMDPFSRLEHRAAEGTRLQQMQSCARAPGHVVRQGGVILTFQV
jgi:hypothetical protein